MLWGVAGGRAEPKNIILRMLLLWLLLIPACAPVVSADPPVREAGLSARAGKLSDWIAEQTTYTKPALPAIRFASQRRLEELCFPGFSHDLLPMIRGAYDARSVVIYLNSDYVSSSRLDISFLLHELVHHFQVTNGQTSSRNSKSVMEAEAIRLQLKWLEQNGTTDGMNLLGIDQKTLRMLEASPR